MKSRLRGIAIHWGLGSLALLGFGAALLSAGCNRDRQAIEIDHRFSYNVAKVPLWYPPEDYVPSPTEQAVLARWGKPNFIRFWWLPDGEFITSSDLSGKSAMIDEIMTETKRTWIYLGEETEIEFLTDGGYLEHPLTEKLKLICRYGDPNQRTPPKQDEAGRTKESWEWIEAGLRVHFIDGAEYKREHFPGTGRGTYLIK
jgi:hypothetical protein